MPGRSWLATVSAAWNAGSRRLFAIIVPAQVSLGMYAPSAGAPLQWQLRHTSLEANVPGSTSPGWVPSSWPGRGGGTPAAASRRDRPGESAPATAASRVAGPTTRTRRLRIASDATPRGLPRHRSRTGLAPLDTRDHDPPRVGLEGSARVHVRDRAGGRVDDAPRAGR